MDYIFNSDFVKIERKVECKDKRETKFSDFDWVETDSMKSKYGQIFENGVCFSRNLNEI